MMYPDFRSEVADETGRLVYEASILFLFACQSGNLNAVQYLIKLNGNLAESVDNFGDNGVGKAALQGKIDTVVFLIEELGIDPAVKGRYGRNSFLYACYGGNIETVKYLAEKYPKLINSVDDDNESGLHLAAWIGKTDTLVYLIEELGLDPAVKGWYERNSFLYACYSGNIEIVKYLAEKYPKLINSVDEDHTLLTHVHDLVNWFQVQNTCLCAMCCF